MQQKLIVKIEVESEYMFTSYDVELALRAYSPANKFFVKEAAQQSVQSDGAKCLKCGRTQKQHDEALLNGHSFDPPRR